jgi:chromosomal replication initiator protein
LTASDREATAALERAIAQRVGEPRYNLWFDGHTKFAWEDDRLTVGVPNLHFQEWLEKTFANAVRAAAAEVFGRPMQLRFAIDPELFQAARREQASLVNQETEARSRESGKGRRTSPDQSAAGKGAKSGEPGSQYSAPSAPPAAAAEPRFLFPNKRRWRRLGDFVVGACNRVAHASAVSVVEAPGQGANPLVLYGPVGTGKTHLLEGIYAGLRKSQPGGRVCYVTAEDFTNRFVQALRFGKLGAFRKHFRECDALLLDDLHFVARKRASEEEFLHTFDALLGDGRQVVVTCDCHPKLAGELTPELTDRLLGGALWGLAPPDAATRLDILRAKAGRGGDAPIFEEVLRFLAEQLRGNVRELEGALHSVTHYSRVSGRPVDVALAREALADLLRHAVRLVQLADVDRAVCRVLCLDSGALQSKRRAWAVSHPRMLAMYLARKHTPAAYSEVGQFFGGRNHSTAVAAEKKVRRWLQDDGELALGARRLRLREVIELVERELLR